MKINFRNIHFIGIGGISMSSIAEFFFYKGYQISGSDIYLNNRIKKLIKLGIIFFLNHKKSNIIGTELIIISSSISEKNPEIIEAKNRNIPIIKRGEILAEIMRFKYGIAVSGTHGKTTTTSLLAFIMLNAFLDPTYFIGGSLNKKKNDTFKIGKSKYLLTEADESDKSFLFLNPIISIITSIDNDHLEFYSNNFLKLKKSFIAFANKIPFYGKLFICNDEVDKKIFSKIIKPFSTYGFSTNSDIIVNNFIQKKWKSEFSLYQKSNPKIITNIKLNLPGKFNVLNATAAILVAKKLNIDEKIINYSMKKFPGIIRRIQYHGKYTFNNVQIDLIEDYAHHPREIRYSIKCIKNIWKNKKIILVYQPHRFKRTKILLRDFVLVLKKNISKLIFLNIFSFKNTFRNKNNKLLYNKFIEKYKTDVFFAIDENKLINLLKIILNKNNILVFQGAGNIISYIDEFKKYARKN